VNVLALDLSLVCTGWASNNHLLRSPGTIETKKRGCERLQTIRDIATALASDSQLVVLEGYSYGSKGSAVINIGELGGVVRLALFEAGHPVVEIPPPCLKKLATGKGNVGKAEVLVEAVKRLGFEGANHNIADALWLLEAAKQHYGLPGAVKLPQTHLAAPWARSSGRRSERRQRE
jgi:crossover junction endodeoxyribonuclease RuvC